MATGHLTVFENYLLLFSELKRRTHDDPERIRWLWKQSKKLRNIGENIRRLHGDLERALVRSHKLIGPVPPGFDEAFTDYRERYQEIISGAWVDAFWDEGLESMNARKAQTEDDQEESEERFVIEEFDPEIDDAYEEFVRVIEYARLSVEIVESGGHDDPILINGLSRGLGAWDFYRDPIGVDMEGIARRWKKVPHFFIPRHVLDRYGRSERGSLSHLLNDAIRAYVFGVPTAAIVMCRTVYEEFLKKHLGLEIPKNKKGFAPKLSKIIVLAEKNSSGLGHWSLDKRPSM